MHNFTKSYFLCVLLLLCSVIASAQQKPAPVKLFFEKVYVHTDRDQYAQGDTIWYKAYVVNAQTNAPIFISGNLYTELISKKNSGIVERQIVQLNGSSGNAEFALSDSIPSGKYVLRAYTNWMRNFGDNFVFEKDITVINTLSVTTGSGNKTAASVNNTATSNIKNLNVPNGPAIRFYPESGSLIEGVNSLVAVKAEDITGKGVTAKGAVLSAAGDTAAIFSCDSLGMGMFLLMPVKGQVYHAVGSYRNSKLAYDVPQALAKGFTMRVNHHDSLINVIINCNDATLADATGKSFTLTGRHGGKTYFRHQLAIASTQNLVTVSDALFPDGIVALTLTEDAAQAKPHSERLVYVHHAIDTTMVSVKTDKAVYGSKEKVTVNIKTNGGKSNLSLACIDAGIVPVQDGNIVSYLELASELKGKIEKADRYFDAANTARFKQLDLLLMTQGWRDFVWRRMQDTAIRISYNSENGLTVSGKVVNGNSGKAIGHANITMFANSNRGTKLFSASSDSLGRFLFTDLQQYGDHAVKLTSSNNKGDKIGSFSVDTLAVLPVKAYNNNNMSDTANAALVKAAVKRREAVVAEKMKGTTNLKEVKITASRRVNLWNGVFTGFGPDQVFDITPQDTKFKTLEWYLQQNSKGFMESDTPGITGLVALGSDTVRISAGAYQARTRQIPLQFIVNGVEKSVDDPTEAEVYRIMYYNLPIDKVKKIVIRHVVGNLLNSRSMSAAVVMVDRYIVYLTISDDAFDGNNSGLAAPQLKGFYQAKTFYKPVYDNPAMQNKMDLRTTLHWEPNIVTDTNGEATVTFYNADPKTKVRIVAEGITDKGVPVSTTAIYTVK